VSAPQRIAAFVAALAALFAGAALLGGAIDPDVEANDQGHEGTEEMNTTEAHEMAGTGSSATLPGLAVASGDYRMVAERSDLPAAAGVGYRYRIEGPGGEPVTSLDVEHERPMHLIVVRRDLTGFQHVHPELGPDGTWSAPIDTRRPGTYRVFADFAAGGESMTLGTDLEVAGRFDPVPLPEPTATAAAGDGYEVHLYAGHPEAGSVARTEFTISRDGEPIRRVEPYLGAAGHLVALRAGDLAFLHTHPAGAPEDADPIAFDVSYPSAGSYRLFLQFRHGGEVHTAAFTVDVEGSHG